MLGTSQEPARGADVEATRVQVGGPHVQVLFAEARRRRRHRRQFGATISLIVAGTAAAAVIAGGGGHDAGMRRGDGQRPSGAAKSQDSRLAQPSVRLAWLDYDQLMIGDPATGARHAGPAVDASPTAPLIFTAGQLFWADANRDGAPIRDYNLATAKIRYLPGGESVFASFDGRHLYIVRSSRVLLELSADGSGRPVVLTAPAGWRMSGLTAGWAPTQAADSIIVYSSATDDYVPRSSKEGLWNPATGRVRILGAGIWIFGVYTPPGGRYSLIVWAPQRAESARDDSLRITNTATGSTVAVRSPLHHGFVGSGAPAFSPGGKQMAVFVRTGTLGFSPGLSRLAIVDVGTGAVRVVPGTALYTNEDAFWAIWPPGGQQVIAGALESGYLVDARTLAVRPFGFFGNSTDGFSAVVLPGRQA